MAHAKLSASGAHRWSACPGSVAAEEGIPDRSSSFAEEGTRAHDIMEKVLNRQGEPSDYTKDQEMIDGVQLYVDYVMNLYPERKLKSLFVERRVSFADWVPDGFGTADTILITDDVLHVVDLKYGKGVQVFADNNPQALLYALGAYSEFEWVWKPKTVKVSIVQPRLDHISEFEISVSDLMKFGEAMQQAAAATQEPDAPRVPGEKQCRFCKAKATCPALMKMTADTVLADFDDLEPSKPANSLTQKQLSMVMFRKPMIEAWLSAVEKVVKEKLLTGENFEGFKLVEGRSLRKWQDENDAEELLSEYFDDNQIFSRKLISPSQAEKLIGKKLANKISHLIVKPQGAPTIAQEHDPRPAIKSVASMFDIVDSDDFED
jgi:uncharacterized protein (DUF2249 family)